MALSDSEARWQDARKATISAAVQLLLQVWEEFWATPTIYRKRRSFHESMSHVEAVVLEYVPSLQHAINYQRQRRKAITREAITEARSQIAELRSHWGSGL